MGSETGAGNAATVAAKELKDVYNAATSTFNIASVVEVRFAGGVNVLVAFNCYRELLISSISLLRFFTLSR